MTPKLALFTALAAAAAAPPAPPLSTIFTSHTLNHTCFRVPGAVTAPSGDLLVFVEARGASCADNAPKDVALARSSDGGATWGAPQIVVAGYSAGTNHTCRNPTPVFAADGTLVLQFVNTTVEPWVTRQVTSADEGRTWGAPTAPLPAGAAADSMLAGPGAGLRLANSGRLLFCGTNYYDPGARPPVGARVWTSDDGGRSWDAQPAAFFAGMAECAMAQLNNGSVLINFRANHHDAACACRAQARSDDGGATFTPFTSAPALVEPVCSAGLLEAGGALYFSNPASRTARVNMTVRRSNDGGATWPAAVTVWPAGAAYSVLVPLAQGHVGIVFERIAAGEYSDVVFAAPDF